MAKANKLSKLEGKYKVRGHLLTVVVHPCTWMYEYYGFQIGVKSQDGVTDTTLHSKEVNCETVTKKDVLHLLHTELEERTCKACKKEHLVQKGDKDIYRQGCCQPCHLARVRAIMDQELAAEREKLLKKDRQMKKKGYIVRVDAWIHPRQGDDFEVGYYMKNMPTEEEIKKMIKKEGSVVLTDYTVTTL